MRRAGVVAVVAVLVLATGLAGTAFAKPLSKRAYIKAADDICGQALTLIDQAGQDTIGDVEQPSPEQQEAFVTAIEPVLTQELDSLGELVAPKADAKKLKKLFKLVEKGYDQIIDDPSILDDAEPPPALVKASKRAAAYGFEVCGT